MTEPVMAFLIMPYGPRQTCVGCSQVLVEKGLLRLIFEHPLNVDNRDGPTPTVAYYAIADDYTLDDCREVIKDRHVGPEWGS